MLSALIFDSDFLFLDNKEAYDHDYMIMKKGRRFWNNDVSRYVSRLLTVNFIFFIFSFHFIFYF